MVRLLGLTLVPALLGWSLAAAPVAAQNTTSFVHDDAAFFSKEAINKANADIARMRAQFKRELVVDTVVSVNVPADANNTAAVNRFFDTWAEKRFLQDKVDGVYIVIVQNPPKERVQLGNKTEQSGVFRNNDRQELENLLIADLKAAHKEQMKNQAKNDKVLLDATAFVHDRMSQHARQATDRRQQAPAVQHGAQHPNAGGTPWLTYILIGIGVFLVIWVIMGIIRGLSGGGVRGGPGMAGGGYGGGGGGGGGGGFLSSMLGGLFGAAAGMWMYNSFFGGHSSSAWGAGPDGGYGSNAANDADTGSTGGGGDYGDTGGDQGGSGGGDTGGGDWGGGGGDDAGGGGGDWGGGGGGDFGGGGGDFGGGGGGGDW